MHLVPLKTFILYQMTMKCRRFLFEKGVNALRFVKKRHVFLNKMEIKTDLVKNCRDFLTKWSFARLMP